MIVFAERELAGKTFDIVFVSCTNFRAVEARPLLMRRCGVPVVTSNQATIEAALHAVGAIAKWSVPIAA